MSGLRFEEIVAILPHRYPFLLVDRIIEIGDRHIVGIKNVTINEHYFQGHIPGHPVMPGVLVVEAMAQVGGCLILHAPEMRGRLIYLVGIDRCRFRRPIVPGDTLRIEVELRALRGSVGKAWCVARVGDDIAAEAEIAFALPDEIRAPGGERPSFVPAPVTPPGTTGGKG